MSSVASKPTTVANPALAAAAGGTGGSGAIKIQGKDAKAVMSTGMTTGSGQGSGVAQNMGLSSNNDSAGGGSGSGVNSSSDGRNTNLSSSRNQGANSKLSNTTRMINQVTAVQQKMDQRAKAEGTDATNAKVM